MRKPEVNIPDLGKPKIPGADNRFEIKQPGIPGLHGRSKSSSESSDDDRNKVSLKLGGIPDIKRKGFDDSSSDSSDADRKAKITHPGKPEINAPGIPKASANVQIPGIGQRPAVPKIPTANIPSANVAGNVVANLEPPVVQIGRTG